MASQIERPHILGNFRTRKPKEKKERKTDSRPGMSEEHLALVRKLPCCITGRVPAGEAHHLKATGERGMGLRSTDRWAIPMAHDPHMEVERAGSRNELTWFKARGIDAIDLATSLWLATGDLPKMTKIVIAHRAGAGNDPSH